jgi:hypothetical protein
MALIDAGRQTARQACDILYSRLILDTGYSVSQLDCTSSLQLSPPYDNITCIPTLVVLQLGKNPGIGIHNFCDRACKNTPWETHASHAM